MTDIADTREVTFNSSAEKIRRLNDEFRFRPTMLGKLVVTDGVASLPDVIRDLAVIETRLFSDFNEDNDPHGEHDFGSFTFQGHKFFWKIDYYDKNLQYGSEDPANPEVTTRVLTIMLAEEY